MEDRLACHLVFYYKTRGINVPEGLLLGYITMGSICYSVMVCYPILFHVAQD